MTNLNHENERPHLPAFAGGSGEMQPAQLESPSSSPAAPKQGRTRREFRWSRTAREMVRNNPNASPAEFSALLTRLVQESGNPRWACRRFMHRMGMRSTRQHRRWTIQEQQRLVKLLDLHPVPEIARLMRRSQSSIWHMMQRLGANAKMGKDSFTKYTLAVALHVRPEKIEEWINKGWLKTREVHTNAGKRTLIDAEEFCEFCRKHTRDAVGNRLSRERLEFVYHFAFPPSHAELLPVRESKKERSAFAAQMRKESADTLVADLDDHEEEAGQGDDEPSSRIA